MSCSFLGATDFGGKLSVSSVLLKCEYGWPPTVALVILRPAMYPGERTRSLIPNSGQVNEEGNVMLTLY